MQVNSVVGREFATEFRRLDLFSRNNLVYHCNVSIQYLANKLWKRQGLLGLEVIAVLNNFKILTICGRDTRMRGPTLTLFELE